MSWIISSSPSLYAKDTSFDCQFNGTTHSVAMVNQSSRLLAEDTSFDYWREMAHHAIVHVF